MCKIYILARNIAHISSSRFYDPYFLQTKNRNEQKKLSFNTFLAMRLTGGS